MQFYATVIDTKRTLSMVSIFLIGGLLLFSLSSFVQAETEVATLEVSKSVSGGDMLPGGTIEYSIVVSATGSGFTTFQLTDTLPLSTTYVADSLTTDGAGFDIAVNNNVITSSEFPLVAGQSVNVSFDVTIDASTPISTLITNTVTIVDTGVDQTFTDSAVTMVITETEKYVFLPFIARPLDAPTNNPITAPTGATNTWTVSWEDLHTADSRVTGYEIQESTDASFSEGNTTSTEVAKVTSLAISKPVNNQIVYYYRVRSVASGLAINRGTWSNVQTVESVYFYQEHFNDDANPNNWRIVRQDTDEIVNKISVHDGYLDLRMESRFDYMIASNMTKVPENHNFRVTARMRLEDADPRHAGGIILGGDYDGTSECPKKVDEDKPENSDYSTCFTEYYRFMFIAGNVSNQFTTQIKRIEEHSDTNNSGSGTELAKKEFISKKGRKNWIEWSIEVYQDGTMKMYLEDELLHEINDTTYRDNKYFGFWSSTADTTFSNTQIDWVTVEPID